MSRLSVRENGHGLHRLAMVRGAICIGFCFFLMVLPAIAQGVSFVLPNETVVFSFSTASGKRLAICETQDGSYLVYRYGSPNKVELQFPDKSQGSWSKFTYSFYLRGGGVENEGEDLNYVSFQNGGFTYTVFEEYTASDDATRCGIRVEDSKGAIIAEIEALPESVKGTLVSLRDNGKITKQDFLQ